jgi:hypothetical protein
MEKRKLGLKCGWSGAAAGLLLSFALALPPAHADGGPILDDVELWAQIEEGMQIAVVHLDAQEDTAQVDLFISLLDTSGESHEITFFVPLGSHAAGFDVSEESSLDFDAVQTEELDDRLADAAAQEAQYKAIVRVSFLPGALVMVPWSWLYPLAGYISLFTMGLQGPMATFQTEHSRVALYDMDTDTDIEELIAVTGLDPAVQETLRRFAGQQIAVITMQTQPTATGTESQGYLGTSGQPGLHLAWTTTLIPGNEGGAYAYPLGTGSAWARPIQLTRVYVVAPPGVDFRVTYPRLGKNRSGYVTGSFGFGPYTPRIMEYTTLGMFSGAHVTYLPGYAVDQAVGDFGRVWRATYVQSNAAEDVVVTRVEDLLPETRAALRRPAVRQWIMRFTWVVGLPAALAVWVAAYHFVMSRRLNIPYRWADPKLWKHAIGWALVYPLSNVIPLSVLVVLVSFPQFAMGLSRYLGETITRVLAVATGVVAIVLFIPASFGIVSGFLFVRHARHRMGTPWRRAAGAYVLVIATSSAGYGLFALAYLALVRGL